MPSRALLSGASAARQAGMVFASAPTMTPRMAGEEWDAIDAYDVQPLESLFERDADRLSAMTLELGGIYFDWSKTHLDGELLDRFVAVAEGEAVRGCSRCLVLGRDRQSDRRPSGRACRGARDGCRGCRRARRRSPNPHARSGRRDRGRGVRRRDGRPPHRHRRFGAWAGAAGRCARAPQLAAGRSLPVEHRRRSVRRCRADARSSDDAYRDRVEDVHDRRDPGQHERRAGLAAGGGVDDPYRPRHRRDCSTRGGARRGHRRDPHPPVQRRRGRPLLAVERRRPVRGAGARLERFRGIARGCGGDGPPLPLRRACRERAADRRLHRPALRSQVRLPDARGLRL